MPARPGSDKVTWAARSRPSALLLGARGTGTIGCMRSLAWLLSAAFFFLNPNLACGPDEPAFRYGATEMRQAVEGDWALTITPAGDPALHVVVHVAQASSASVSLTPAAPSRLVRSAHACGTRTLVRGAAACLDVSQMPLAVSYVSGDSSFASASMSGGFTVVGLAFNSGEIELKVGPYQILSQVTADGTLVDPHLGPLGTTVALVVTRQ